MNINGGNNSIYVLPGQTFKFTSIASWVSKESQQIPNSNGGPSAYETKTLVNGFAVENELMGDIKIVKDEPSVIYTHKKFGSNKVFYFGKSGESATIDILSVPIHDHSSIVTGGPAYGTYFTDDETI